MSLMTTEQKKKKSLLTDIRRHQVGSKSVATETGKRLCRGVGTHCILHNFGRPSLSSLRMQDSDLFENGCCWSLSLSVPLFNRPLSFKPHLITAGDPSILTLPTLYLLVASVA